MRTHWTGNRVGRRWLVGHPKQRDAEEDMGREYPQYDDGDPFRQLIAFFRDSPIQYCLFVHLILGNLRPVVLESSPGKRLYSSFVLNKPNIVPSQASVSVTWRSAEIESSELQFDRQVHDGSLLTSTFEGYSFVSSLLADWCLCF